MGRTGRPSGGQSPTRGGRGVAGVRGGEQGVSRDGVQEMARGWLGGENYPGAGISEWEDLGGGSRFGLRGGKE